MERKTARLTLGLLLAFLFNACAGQRANTASEAKTSLVGKSEAQVLTCMGVPPQRANAGQTKVWSYPSGGDTTTVGFAGSSYSMRKYCVVNVVISDGRVTAVNYAGRTGSLDEQCAFAVKNCTP